MKLLNDCSEYYHFIKDDRYSNGRSFEQLLEIYCEYVRDKYESLLIHDGKNSKTADLYHNKLSEPVKRNGLYIQYPKSDIGMNKEDLEKTLMLMREAVIAYYKAYHNKMMVAMVSTADPRVNEDLEFVIKEEQLLHLLGVTANQLRSNTDFIKLTGKSNMNSVEILEWIIRDTEGNKDLIQFEEDFIKRINNRNFQVINDQRSGTTQSRLLNYYKIRTKSQAFIKYGPLEKVSLVAKLQNGKKLTPTSSSNTAMISRAECFQKYPWAYFGSVQNQDNIYMETLIIDDAKGKKTKFNGSIPAIVKGIYTLDTDGGGLSEHIFSEEEQFNLFCLAYDAFKNTMNFDNLIEYFLQLSKKLPEKQEDNGSKKR